MSKDLERDWGPTRDAAFFHSPPWAVALLILSAPILLALLALAATAGVLRAVSDAWTT